MQWSEGMKKELIPLGERRKEIIRLFLSSQPLKTHISFFE